MSAYDLIQIRPGKFINPDLILDIEFKATNLYSQDGNTDLQEDDINPSHPFKFERMELSVVIQMAAMILPTDLFYIRGFGTMHPMEYTLVGEEAQNLIAFMQQSAPAQPAILTYQGENQ